MLTSPEHHDSVCFDFILWMERKIYRVYSMRKRVILHCATEISIEIFVFFLMLGMEKQVQREVTEHGEWNNGIQLTAKLDWTIL